MRGKGLIKFIIVIAILGGLVCGAYFFALKTGLIWKEDVDEELYKVRGVAVDESNGDIDWLKAKKEGNVSFAFIRATEGTAIKDRKFAVNYVGAVKAGINVSIYHKYILGSNALTQIKHYGNTVRVKGAKLKPSIVFDLDADTITDEEIKTVKNDMMIMAEYIMDNYRKNAIIYTTEEIYKKVFDISAFDINNVTLINLKYKPLPMDASRWHFWQYSIDGKVPGITTPVNKLVYTGTPGDFENYMAHTN